MNKDFYTNYAIYIHIISTFFHKLSKYKLWLCWGNHNLILYNHFKNRPTWHDVECHKRFECVFLITNEFWDGMTQFTVRQMISELWSWVWVTGMSLWGRDCWEDHNLTIYNHSKNRPTWCDVECHKRFECIFLITNWFWSRMTQLTVRQIDMLKLSGKKIMTDILLNMSLISCLLYINYYI